MAETAQLAARVGWAKGKSEVDFAKRGRTLPIDKAFRQREDGRVTRGATAPN